MSSHVLNPTDNAASVSYSITGLDFEAIMDLLEDDESLDSEVDTKKRKFIDDNTDDSEVEEVRE